MEMKRTVPVPLSRHPDLLWGLKMEDLPWLVGGILVDCLIWRHVTGWGLRLGLISVPSVVSMGLAWLRVEQRSLARWTWLWFRFHVKPKRFLP